MSFIIGQMVQYTLGEMDANTVNNRRKVAQGHGHRANLPGVQIHMGNEVKEGDVFPAVIVRDWGACVNLKVMLDGDDSYWATSRIEGEGPNRFKLLPAGDPDTSAEDALHNEMCTDVFCRDRAHS
jgi:hypothetical protein